MKAWLTIDDSPSAQTDDLTAALKERHVPALLFCRGDRLDDNPQPVVRAIKSGFVIGNHAWSHTRFSTLSFEACKHEIADTDRLIDAAYEDADVTRPAKYFRFPHMDRGCGGWVVDYDAVPEHWDALIALFAGGLNIDLSPPDAGMQTKKRALQDYLRAAGFVSLPVRGITLPWFTGTEMARAVDAMFTFSTSDWMITPRHAGKWPYKTLADLIARIDADAGLQQGGSQVILAHDQDGLLDTVIALVDHMLDRGFAFESF